MSHKLSNLQGGGPPNDSGANNRYLATRNIMIVLFGLQSTFEFIISFHLHNTPGREAIIIIVAAFLYYYYSHHYEEMAVQRPQSGAK